MFFSWTLLLIVMSEKIQMKCNIAQRCFACYSYWSHDLLRGHSKCATSTSSTKCIRSSYPSLLPSFYVDSVSMTVPGFHSQGLKQLVSGIKNRIRFCATYNTEFETFIPLLTWSSRKWLLVLCKDFRFVSHLGCIGFDSTEYTFDVLIHDCMFSHSF